MANVIEIVKILIAVIQLITSLGLQVESVKIDGFPQQIYTLKLDLTEVELFQKLSRNQVYGFETVLELAEKTDGKNLDINTNISSKEYYDFGVNGSFYTELGRPAGIFIFDGELITKQTIGSPLFILRYDGTIDLIDPQLSTFIEHNKQKYETYELNEGQTNTLISVFTPWYGSTDRMRELHTSLVVQGNKVDSILVSEQPVSIPNVQRNLKNGDFMVTFRDLKFPFEVKVGDEIRFLIESNFNHQSVKEAFQTGGWLVRDGENVAKTYESYIGTTNSLQPRTAIGITKDNKVIIKVVDGRQKGVSEGVTGNQLADLFIEADCISAAYLDGGASTTMVKNGILMNNPSLGEPKGVSHGLFFERDYQKVVAK